MTGAYDRFGRWAVCLTLEFLARSERTKPSAAVFLEKQSSPARQGRITAVRRRAERKATQRGAGRYAGPGDGVTGVTRDVCRVTMLLLLLSALLLAAVVVRIYTESRKNYPPGE